MEKITVIGSGLAGCTMAIYLAKQGYSVDIFERRSDIRRLDQDFGRSINLALMQRGLHTFTEIGLLDEVKAISVPMRARAIHQPDGETKIQPFGRNDAEYLHAISRAELNKVLLNAIDELPNVEVHFDKKLVSIDFTTDVLTFEDSNNQQMVEHSVERVIAADGVGSATREAMQQAGLLKFIRTQLAHSYKELVIPKEYGHLYPQETLMSWPRQSFMLLANPNRDGSWTCSLFLDNEGDDSFANLQTEQQLTQFFKKYFPDLLGHLPTLIEDYFEHPLGTLNTVKCEPWFHQDKYLLIGDAAHGIVPFFAQGMNSSLEDCKILNDCITEFKGDWCKIFATFYDLRKPNLDAVAEMSFDNYQEIRDQVNRPNFHLRKQIEWELMSRYTDDYLAKHVMVMFYRHSYRFAQACGRLQDQLFDELFPEVTSLDDIDWTAMDKRIQQYTHDVAQIKEQLKLFENGVRN